jgi:hypothetical protein
LYLYLHSASISDGDSSNAASGKTPAEEGAVIKALHDFAIQAGGKYYLVEGSWWQQWKVIRLKNPSIVLE